MAIRCCGSRICVWEAPTAMPHRRSLVKPFAPNGKHARRLINDATTLHLWTLHSMSVCLLAWTAFYKGAVVVS